MGEQQIDCGAVLFIFLLQSANAVGVNKNVLRPSFSECEQASIHKYVEADVERKGPVSPVLLQESKQ